MTEIDGRCICNRRSHGDSGEQFIAVMIDDEPDKTDGKVPQPDRITIDARTTAGETR